jgi:hypothetical protein
MGLERNVPDSRVLITVFEEQLSRRIDDLVHAVLALRALPASNYVIHSGKYLRSSL